MADDQQIDLGRREEGSHVTAHPLDEKAERVALIAADLAQYAGEQVALPQVNAELAIASSFRQQLLDGETTIDLSQRYATDDVALAQARHETALENLQPVIQETENLGITVERGHAIAHEIGLREAPAMRQGL